MINNRNGIIIIVIMFLGKLIALMRDIFMSKAYGISYVADAYNISYILTVTIFGVISSAITNSLIPALSNVNNSSDDKSKLFGFLSNVINVMSVISIIITIGTILCSRQIVIIIGGELTSDTVNLASNLVKISLISIVFLTLNSILNAILRICNYYKTPVFATLVLNIPSLLYLIFFSNNGVGGLTVALVLGYIIQCLIQIPALVKLGYKHKFFICLKDINLVHAFKSIPSMILASGILQISVMFDNRMAGNLGNGYISSLAIASKVNALVYTVFATSLIQVVYAQMANAYKGKNKSAVKSILINFVNKILILILPMMIVMIMLSKEIITLLFFRGEFSREAVNISSTALVFYSLGLIFYIIRDILNYAFYSMDLKKIPIKIGIYSVIINIILNIILTPLIGIGGISLATSIAAVVSVIVLRYKLSISVGNMILINKRELLKVIIGIIPIIINIIIYKSSVNSINIISLAILEIVSCIEYLFILFILKHSEIKVKRGLL